MERTAWLVAALVLLAFPTLGANAQETPGAAWEITDPAGDVKPSTRGLFGGPAGGPLAQDLDAALPSNEAIDPLDLVRAFIEGDNETHVTLGIQVKSMQDLAGAFERGSGLNSQFRIHFRLEGWSEAALRIEWPGFGCLLCPDFTEFYAICKDDTEFGFECRYTDRGIAIDEASGTVRFVLLRDDLSLVEEESSRKIRQGDRIAGLWVESFDFATADRMPDEGEAPPYEFVHGTANDRLALFLDGDVDEPEPGTFVFAGSPRPMGIAVGETGTFTLQVWNRLTTKAVVNLQAEVGDAAAWNVTLPPTVIVPANTSVPVTLVVVADGGLGHRASTALRVRATTAAAPSQVGLLLGELVAAQSPTPTLNTLHFHSTKHTFPFMGDPVDSAAAPVLGMFNTYVEPRLNVLADDATYDETPVPVTCLSSNQGYLYASMDTPLTRDLRFDLAGEGSLDLALRAKVPTPLAIEGYVFAGDELVGSVEGEADVGTTDTAVPLPFAIALGEDTVDKAAGALWLRLTFTPISADPFGFGSFSIFCGGDSPEANVLLVPGGSSLTLPLLDPPPEPVTSGTGERRLSVSLRPGKDSLEYVNPGDTVAFPLRVTNEGLREEEARLALNGTAGAWKVEWRPGTKVRLAPGESANLTLLLQAPANAAEGDRLALQVVATSKDDPAVTSRLGLVAVATRGVDLEDERAEGEPLAPKAKSSRDSPLPGPVALSGAAAAFLIYCRRRRVGQRTGSGPLRQRIHSP